MWIVTGPTSKVPDDGEGIEARAGTAHGILPVGGESALEEDPERQLGVAPGAHEADRVVQVDVWPGGQHGGGGGLEAGALELAGTPALDPLLLGLRGLQLGRSHSHLLHGRCTPSSTVSTRRIAPIRVNGVKAA